MVRQMKRPYFFPPYGKDPSVFIIIHYGADSPINLPVIYNQLHLLTATSAWLINLKYTGVYNWPVAQAYFKNRQGHQNTPTAGPTGGHIHTHGAFKALCSHEETAQKRACDGQKL